MRRLILLIPLCIACASAQADNQRGRTIHVPGAIATIQAAIELAAEGDTVLVAAGTYTENLVFQGRDIVLRGAGVGATVLDADRNGSGIVIESGESRACVVEHMSIVRGTGTVRIFPDRSGFMGGGGIFVEEASPTLRQLRIERCKPDWEYRIAIGGGVHLRYSQARIEAVALHADSAGAGGGIFATDCTDLELVGLTITDCEGGLEGGGGIEAARLTGAVFDSLIITSCTGKSVLLYHDAMGGAILASGTDVTIRNSIFTDNVSNAGGAIYFYSGGPFYVENCLFARNFAGSSGDRYPGPRYGGAICAWGVPDVDVTNCTFVDNFAVGRDWGTPEGLAVAMWGGTFVNNIVTDHKWYSAVIGPERREYNLYFHNDLDFYGDPAEGEIFTNPHYLRPRKDDYRLRPNSPAIDAGDPARLDPDGSRSDIGAFPVFRPRDLLPVARE